MSAKRTSDSSSIASNDNSDSNKNENTGREGDGLTMNIQEIQDQRTKEAERESRMLAQEQLRQQQQQQNNPPPLSSSESQQTPEYREEVTNFWQSQFDKASRRNLHPTSSLVPPRTNNDKRNNGKNIDKEDPVSPFHGKVGAFASTSNIVEDDDEQYMKQDSSKAFATTDATGDVVLSFRKSKDDSLKREMVPLDQPAINPKRDSKKPRKTRMTTTSSTTSSVPAPTMLRRTTPVPTVHPGAVAVDGPGANSSVSTRSSAVAEVLASMGTEEASSIVNDSIGDRTTTTAAATGNGDVETPHKDDVIADMVDDAEVIHYAEDVRFDFIRRHRTALIGAALVATVAIVTLLRFVIKFKPPPVCVRPPGDSRCWEIPNEKQSIAQQCACYNHTMHALDAVNFTAKYEDRYQHILELLQSRHVIDPNWTVPIETLAVVTTNYTCDVEPASSVDEEESIDDFTETIELLNEMYSCDPTNQVLLEMAVMEYDTLGTLEEVQSAPENLLIDLFALKFMYVSMGGINWEQTSGWFDVGDVCDLHGLDCMFVSLFHTLSLPNNNLVGTIPDVLSHLRSIRIIDLSNNKGITGTIPSFLAGMTSLNTIDFSGCSLTGSIPPHFGELEELTSLSLDNNFFTGSVPAELFADLDHLEALNLNQNAFNGTIPTEIGIAKRLQTLRIQDNQFSGELPTEILSLKRLELLNLGKNNFTGPIPDFLGWSMPGLELVSLFESGFTGAVPNTYCDMPAGTLSQQDNDTTSIINDTAVDVDEESESDDPPSPRPEQKVLVIGCDTTDACDCCKNRGTRIDPGEIHVECAEDLGVLQVGF